MDLVFKFSPFSFIDTLIRLNTSYYYISWIVSYIVIHYLELPANKPWIKYFCKNKYAIKTGKEINTIKAYNSPKLIEYWPTILYKPTVTVVPWRGPSKINGFKKSFHTQVPVIIITLAAAGFNVTESNYINEIDPQLVERYALDKNEIIYFCQKI